METQEKFDAWAIVELMGHQRMAGHVTEETVAGAALMRIDVPECEGRPAFTKYFSNGAIYALTPCTEETARAAARSFRKQPAVTFDMRAWIDGPQQISPPDDDDYQENDYGL